MYQIRTHFPLCNSKAYCGNKKSLMSHIDKIIKETNKFRASLSDLEKSMYLFPPTVTNAELEEALHILKIEKTLLPLDKEVFLGKEMPITKPVNVPEKKETTS